MTSYLNENCVSLVLTFFIGLKKIQLKNNDHILKLWYLEVGGLCSKRLALLYASALRDRERGYVYYTV